MDIRNEWRPQRPQPTTAEQIHRLIPKLAAFAWQNFLKRIANGWEETEAKAILEDDINKYASLKEFPEHIKHSLLGADSIRDQQELVEYYSGSFDPKHSHYFGNVLRLPREKVEKKPRTRSEQLQAEYKNDYQVALGMIKRIKNAGHDCSLLEKSLRVTEILFDQACIHQDATTTAHHLQLSVQRLSDLIGIIEQFAIDKNVELEDQAPDKTE